MKLIIPSCFCYLGATATIEHKSVQHITVHISTCKIQYDSLEPITELSCPSVPNGPRVEPSAAEELLTWAGICSLHSGKWNFMTSMESVTALFSELRYLRSQRFVGNKMEESLRFFFIYHWYVENSVFCIELWSLVFRLRERIVLIQDMGELDLRLLNISCTSLAFFLIWKQWQKTAWYSTIFQKSMLQIQIDS